MTEPIGMLWRTAKLHPRKGVVINYVTYWSEMLEDRSLYGRILEVRYDPHDVSTVWVRTHGVWTECHSREYVRMKGVSVSTLKAAAREFRRVRKSMRGFGQKHLTEFFDRHKSDSAQRSATARSEEDA